MLARFPTRLPLRRLRPFLAQQADPLASPVGRFGDATPAPASNSAPSELQEVSLHVDVPSPATGPGSINASSSSAPSSEDASLNCNSESDMTA